MSDPFDKIRKLAAKRDEIKHEWSQEVKALHAAGFSLRAIASAAGVSHDTVWKRVR
jgi:lambda repressor-like predicted transcriptional regulator